MKLWLLRHARPLVDSGICYGALDVAADEAATQEAAQQAAMELPAGLLVWYSPLQRCERLAQCLHGLRPDLSMQPEPRLREMDFGCWEGVPWVDIPRTAVEAWTADFAHHAFGGVESTQAVMARVGDALADFRAALGRAGHTQGLWISHAGVVRCMRLLAAGVRQLEDASQWPLEGLAPGRLTVLSLAAVRPDGGRQKTRGRASRH